MTRHYPDWIAAFQRYARFGEAPKRMYFWAAVSAVAGALRRKVWIDQVNFRWYPSFYIVLVAKPGVVAKSTTSGIAMNLLRQVPGIHFGPDVITWQSMMTTFAESTEQFELGEEFIPMSAMTFDAQEFGNLLNTADKDMINMMITLWDGRTGALTKSTKMSGNDSIENPWINMIACTTPSWISDNFREQMVGGGLISRMIFIYGEKKEKLVAYPSQAYDDETRAMAPKLVSDLIEIAKMAGPYIMTREALAWGNAWYADNWSNKPREFEEERFGGWVARKQTHIHKLAMVLSASQGERLLITDDHLITAETMISDLERDFSAVFGGMGRKDDAVHAERLVAYVVKRATPPKFDEVFRYMHAYFPSLRAFEDLMAGCIKAGYIALVQRAGGTYVERGPASPVGASDSKSA